MDLVSVAECDVPTVCDDMREDIEMWIQDVSQELEGDAATPQISSEISSGYIEGISVEVHTE